MILPVCSVDLLNPGVETLCNTVSADHHPLPGRAKDLGSAAVFFSVVNAAVVWILLL